ncbi:MAG: Tex family protein [Porticoccaceae bacterium]
MISIPAVIADELGVKLEQIHATIKLLDEGSTVPFISRYRKEATGGLDDTQLRTLEQRLGYLREMEDRRSTILNSIEEQGKLTEDLKKAILAAETKTALEDLYLPYKPKRRTKGQIAIEAGLEPLADLLFNDPSQDPEKAARDYIDADKGVEDTKAALEGARYILMERFSEDAELIGALRETLKTEGVLSSSVFTGKEKEGEKFQDYFDYKESYKKVPSHRALAIFRGRNEGILKIALDLDLPENFQGTHPCETRVATHFGIQDQGRPADKWLLDCVRWTWRVKLLTHIELDLLGDLREMAEDEAIQVFANNLKDLMMAAPAGPKACIGLDPGLRTGVKVAVIDATGKLVDHCAIYPHVPKNQWDQSIATLANLAKKHRIELIAIGNGTASRETDKLAGDLTKLHPQLKLQKITVSEAGASVYSASEFAAREFPDLDVTIRGAVSIARRLQDPLAELVKIEPKAIGVGQYQHDVNQFKLGKSLAASVEDCVNEVGVDINTASAALLESVSGLNQTTATNIIAFRDENGAYTNRKAILKVPRMGEKTFEQAAGFLRIMNGKNVLDSSSVHPEAYGVVERIAEKNGRTLDSIIGDSAFLRGLNPQDYIDEKFGVPTVVDILKELEKPGRDPRPEFKTANFQEGVETIKDLEAGMILEGTVSNVANFGAFVDIGVHQDGLVHISALSDKFIDDPRKVVKAGDIVKVKVMEIDIDRKRIGLSMRLDDQPGQETPKKAKPQSPKSPGAKQPNQQQRPGNTNNKSQKQPNQNNMMAARLAEAFNRK